MTLTPADLDRIEELAKAATPGPRHITASGEGEFYVDTEYPEDRGTGRMGHVIGSATAHEDAVLWATLAPATVLSLVAAARSVPRWIPVGERLPDVDGEPVLITEPNGAVSIARRTQAEWLAGRMPIPREAVTHWMPLPSPPEPAPRR